MAEGVVSSRVGYRLAVVAFVALTVLAGLFTRAGQLGLYEDDYWSIAPHLGEPLRGLWPLARQHATHWPQGRPLNHLLPPVLGAVGSAWGGLLGVYVLAAVWLAVNGVLVHAAASRLVSRSGALVAVSAYLLFPADSTRLLLTHAAHVQGAMTFLLLGSWLWLLGGWRRATSYPVAALCLLAYETTYLPFVVLPLLVPLERRRLRTWAAHGGAVAATVGLVAAVRMAMGESRALDAVSQPGETLRRMVSSLWLGPLTSVPSFVRAAGAGLRAMDPLALYAATLVAAALVLLLGWEGPGAEDRGLPASPPSAGDRLPPGRVLAGALVAWSFSYALTITNYPPTQQVGRLTSTHTAAAWPAALAIGALFDLLRGSARWRGRLVVALTVAWLAALVGYQHLLQRGYVRAWEEERRFWKSLLLRSPDVGPGWAVMVTGPQRDANPVILSNAWSDTLVHSQIHLPGRGGGGPAFAHLGFLGAQLPLERAGEAWRWRPEFWGGPWLPVDPARLALFEDDHGRLRRVEVIETPHGLLRATAPLPAGLRTDWPDTPVGRLLFPEEFPLR